MKRMILFLCSGLLALGSVAQLHYTLTYADSAGRKLRVGITPAQPVKGELDFIMPRSVPGSYGSVKYDAFVHDVEAVDVAGHRHRLKKNEDDAPRWQLDSSHGGVVSLSYVVDQHEMESRIAAPSDASVIRSGFVGLLNYSVFGWIEGLDGTPLSCTFSSFPDWPIFSTLKPSAQPGRGSFTLEAADYHELADAQTFMGPAFQVREFPAERPLFIVSYAEGAKEYLDDYAWQEQWAMGALKDYFGPLPFPTYCLVLLRSVPLRPLAAPPMAMEHLRSSTFFGDTSAIRRGPLSESDRLRSLTTYLHHMGHAFIPLRCFGDAYRPKMMEVPPVIDDIWFNEGFIWFVCYDTLRSPRLMKLLKDGVYGAPANIRGLDLFHLSRNASKQYGENYRLGMATFSRGALMAEEMDRYIREQTRGQKRMRDVLRYLYAWYKKSQRPFTMEEFPELLREGAGVDLTSIYEKWQKAVK